MKYVCNAAKWTLHVWFSQDAAVHLRRKDTRYVAARARFDIHNPKCKLGESSSANIWFLDGHSKLFNLIAVGWEVTN